MSTTSSPRTLSTERSLVTPATLATGTPPYPGAGSPAGAPGTMTGTTIAAARRTGRPGGRPHLRRRTDAEPVREAVEVPHGLRQRQDRREGRPEDPDPAGDRGRAAAAPGAGQPGRRRAGQPAAAGDAAEPAARRGGEAAGIRTPGAGSGRPDARRWGCGQGGGVRERRAGLRHPTGGRRAVDGGPQAQPRRGAAGRRAGAWRGRAEPDAAADDTGRADQADEPARAGQDAGTRGG